MLRHLGGHGFQPHAGRIEGGAVIGQPQLIEHRVALACRTLRGRARSAARRPARPRCRSASRSASPYWETLDKKRRGAFERVVLRLEPGGVMPAAADLARPKANKSVHLVNVAPDIVGVVGQLAPPPDRWRASPVALALRDAPHTSYSSAKRSGARWQIASFIRTAKRRGTVRAPARSRGGRSGSKEGAPGSTKFISCGATPASRQRRATVRNSASSAAGRDHGCVHRASSNKDNCAGCGANLCRSFASSSSRPGR